MSTKDEQAPISVFLSHMKEDATFARRLARELRDAGIGVCLAQDQLTVGDSIVESIGNMITVSNVLIAVLSSASLRSKWTQYELQLAQEHSDTGIIFACVDGTDLPTRYANYLCLRGSGESAFPYHELVSELRRRFPEAPRYEGIADSIPRIQGMIGREETILRLEKIAARHRFVAIIGMAGIGKTTLAAAFATRARDTALVEQVAWVNGNHMNPEGFMAALERSFAVSDVHLGSAQRLRDVSARLKDTPH